MLGKYSLSSLSFGCYEVLVKTMMINSLFMVIYYLQWVPHFKEDSQWC